MNFDIFVSDDSVANCDVYRKTTFFRGDSGDSLSLTQFSIFCNENSGKYCSNVVVENEYQRRQVMIARTNVNANETPATRNPLRRWGLNDIDMSKSGKNGIKNETFEFLSMPRN